MDSYSSNFSVIGNPIYHSKSPIIHKMFSAQTGVKYNYSACIAYEESFFSFLSSFFLNYGVGANITLPFKKKAFLFSDVLTTRAILAKSVNTLKKLSNGIILGDNTDGAGFLNDLKRLNFTLKKGTVLLLGSGGAAYGIVSALFSLGSSIFVLNRTICKANKLVSHFSEYGKIRVIEWDKLYTMSFDLIINATSSGLSGDVPMLPHQLINSNVYCYDLLYQNSITPFLSWCKKNGAVLLYDGIGMLVYQAAESCFLWHGCYPDVDSVISSLYSM